MKNELGFAILKVAIADEQDIVSARQKTRKLAQFLGFENQDQARLATAVSELSRNVFQYAGSGFVEFFFKNPQTFNVRVSDSGPGIEHIDDILNGLYVSKTGMGIGLLGAKKIMDAFSIETSPGKGTTVVISKLLDRPKHIPLSDFSKLAEELAIKSEASSAFEEVQMQNRELLQALEAAKSAKSDLAELNRELAETNRGVVALYSELDEKAASLQRANIVKTSFLSNMTHEFRTPLSSIISLTRILISRIDGPLNSEQERQVGYIRKSSEDLLELVNDLLDLAKVEAGKVNVKAEEFFLSEMLGALRGVFRPLVNGTNVEFVIEDPPTPIRMHSDLGKISQVLRNLLSNAIKFTENGTIRLSSRIGGNDHVVFTVEDTGSGVDPEHWKTIFEDFGQLATETRGGHKGTGLGLPLSRKLSKLLGGDLWIESQAGKGSKFHLEIPRIYRGEGEAVLFAHERSDSKKDLQATGSDKFKVLVIDDHEPSRYVLKSQISREIGADFIEAEDGQIGLKKAIEFSPDVVFLDLNMPILDGFQVIERLKSDERTRSIPVIINTARKLDSRDREELEKTSAAVLSKDSKDDQQAQGELRSALRSAGFDYKSDGLYP
jgi:signal transduction histidine kinase